MRKSFMLIWVLVLAASCYVACAPSGAVKRSENARSLAAFFPLAVGNSWVYATEFQGQPQADLTVSIVKKEGGYFLDNRPKPSRFGIDGEGLRDGTKRYLLKTPLTEGTEWMSVADLNTVERYRIVDAQRKLRVPAGVFDHCVVVQMEVRMKGNKALRNEVTYAPGVGIIQIRVSLRDGKKLLPQSHLQLKKFELK
jgi:hypothetical protein